jgi:hypothetical protein|tara:strand:+ start:76 stop:276 length:201 start_codon:yes stop_codon:yes gene_type:complete
MWKVIIIVCILGNPCVLMHEDPIKHYENVNDCTKVAETKHNQIIDVYSTHGYFIEYSEFKCKEDIQ